MPPRPRKSSAVAKGNTKVKPAPKAPRRPRGARPAASPSPPAPPYQFHYRDTATGVRVWRGDWSGDQFEVLSRHEFDAVAAVLRRFGCPLRDHTGDDD